MTAEERVAYTRDQGIGVIAIRNPQARNALDDRTRQKLLSTILQAQADPTSTAIVLTGEGGHFCAGGDLRSMPVTGPEVDQRLGEMHAIFLALVEGPKPTIAAVEGAAYGSGFALAMACDFVVAAPSATFGCTFGRVGLAPDTGLVWSLTRRLGPQIARRICLGSQVLGAQEAQDCGLIDELVDVDAKAAAIQMAAAYFEGSARGAVAAVRGLWAASNRDLRDFLDLELTLQRRLLASEDFKEGRAAFFDRRPPRFSQA